MALKATKALTASRRQFLVSVPVAAAAVTGSIPAAAGGTGTGVTPELAKLIAEWEFARDEYVRLNAIDDDAREHYFRIAPEIPERILYSSFEPYPKHNRNCYRGHLRYVCRRNDPGAIPEIILAPYWREQLETLCLNERTKSEYTENIRIAEEFEAADAAAYEAAGCEQANDDMEEALERANELDVVVEEFEAQSWADIAAIARVMQIYTSHLEDVDRVTWESLVENIKRVAEREGV